MGNQKSASSLIITTTEPPPKKGGAIDSQIYKTILMNGIKFKKGEEEPTGPYIIDRELSNEYVQVYFRLGKNPLYDVNTEDSKPYYTHVIINHRATDASDSSEAGNIVAYAVNKNIYQLTQRAKESKRVQMAAVNKYDKAYLSDLENDKIPQKEKHLKSIISTVGFSQGGILAEYVGEGTYEIITFNEAAKPKMLRTFFRKMGFRFESGYTPIVRIRTDGDPISYFNKKSMAITLPPPILTKEEEKNKSLEMHKATNMNLTEYLKKDEFFGVNGLGDKYDKYDKINYNNELKVYGVSNNVNKRILHQKRCNIL